MTTTVDEKTDFYTLLGVARSATVDEIRSAYRKLALQYHPDRHPDDKEAERKFKLISQAYDVLSNVDRRKLYDLGGADGARAAAQGRDFRNASFEDIFKTFSDIFGDVFGATRARGRAAGRGENRSVTIEIELKEAVTGTTKRFEVEGNAICDGCRGTGCRSGAAPVICPTCQGVGSVSRNAGFFSIQTTCASCGGRGRKIADPCVKCMGSGFVNGWKQVEIGIPPGIQDGVRLKLQGLGDPGPEGAPPGDLFCDVRVKEDPALKRAGDDIVSEVRVSFAQAALGGEVEVPTAEGKVKLKIPRGTQNGTLLRIRGAGFPSGRLNGRGDQLVQVTVAVPTKLTKEQEDLIRRAGV